MADTCENIKLIDVKKKISLIQKLISRCEHYTKNPIQLEDSLNGIMFFTNLPSIVIEEATKNAKTKDLKQLLKTQQDLKSKVKTANTLSSHIHNVLHEYYVNRRMIVDVQILNARVFGGHLKEQYNDSEFYKLMQDRGFIWKKLDNDKRCIFIEDPEVQAKRIKYLLDMKRFREENRTIVYVEEKAMPPDEQTLDQFKRGNHYLETSCRYVKIAASPQIGPINFSKNNPDESVTDWILKEVAQHLKPSYVLVTDEIMLNEEPIDVPPPPEARKGEMIQWLESNNIPCNNSMHRAELYELIELYKDKLGNKKYMTERILKSNGIEVVMRPKRGWPELNYFDSLWNMDALWLDILHGSLATVVENRIEMAVNVCSMSTWVDHDKELEKKEMDLYVKDMELEEVMDKLLIYTKDTAMPSALDLPTISEVKQSDDSILSKFSGSW